MSETLQESVEEFASEVMEEGVAPNQRLNFGFARQAGVLLEHSDDGYRLYYRPNASPQAVAEVRRVLGEPFTMESIEAEQFDERLSNSYEKSSNQAMELMGDMGDEMDLLHIAQALPEPEDLLESEDDAPIIRLINALLTEAVRENASDIHIEPFENRLQVRFRVDGVMREVLQPKRVLGPLLVSRIKVMAKLDIAEKRVPQDGRISLRVANRAVDVRVSTLPSGHGERVVLRLLDKQAGRLQLDRLGMDPDSHSRVRETIHRPHGIILVTGPTGSGKTTTLYAALSELNDASRNIMTVEDPIEYFIDGIGQTQVNSKVEMSFARGLRAILRQDPDVVMIGEIRDVETVEIAIQASLTGHLVLSTLHTNTAVGAVTRLRDMGIEPFLLSSTLIGVLAQRLVRLLCPECKVGYQATPTECVMMGVDASEPPTLYHAGEGCEHCNKLGYRGRTGVYEFVPIDERLSSMIHSGASEHDMEAHARELGPSIHQDGMRLVRQGVTSMEEVLRVTDLE